MDVASIDGQRQIDRPPSIGASPLTCPEAGLGARAAEAAAGEEAAVGDFLCRVPSEDRSRTTGSRVWIRLDHTPMPYRICVPLKI